jgi:hypothetical protein
MLSPLERAMQMKFSDIDLKSPDPKLRRWLEEEILPKSNYLNRKARGKQLGEVGFDTLEYIAFKCKQCTGILKKKAKYLYFIILFGQLELHEINEDDYDALVKEYFGE